MNDHRTFEKVSDHNLRRAKAWHPDGIEDWSESDWAVALAGECGELCNIIKKRRRNSTGIKQASGVTDPELLEAAAQEIGDTFLYLDLLAQRLGLDLYECVRDTFNRVSERENLEVAPGLLHLMGR